MDYKNARWKRVRAAILRRDEYICQECRRYGRIEPARIVHHILPSVKCTGMYERLKYDAKNLISLCDKCHERMHIRGTRELSEAGKSLLRRKRVLELRVVD